MNEFIVQLRYNLLVSQVLRLKKIKKNKKKWSARMQYYQCITYDEPDVLPSWLICVFIVDLF